MRCAWPADKRRALFADWRLVAVRQLTIRSCTPAVLAAADHGLGVWLRLETRDVLRHGAGQQFDVLRQIADMPAERIRRPLVERRAVEADVAAHRLPDADQQPRERGFSRAARPDDAEAVAGFEHRKLTSCTTTLAAGRRGADAFDRESPGRRLQRHRRVASGRPSSRSGQALPALARGDEALPVGDRKIDRRERARAQDRAGDDDAGGRLLVDHELGADREHAGLQHHAQHFRHRAEPAGDVARLAAGSPCSCGWPRSSARRCGRSCPWRPALRRCVGSLRRGRCA